MRRTRPGDHDYVAELIGWAATHVEEEPRGGEDLLALCAVSRARDLLVGEMELFDAGLGHLAPVLGRTLIETCLYAQHLLLDPDGAYRRLQNEAGKQLRQRDAGWERLAQLPPIQEIGLEPVRADWPHAEATLNVADLADEVSRLRRGLDTGELEGFTVMSYQMDYRWRSANDVHPGLAVFGRYLASEPDMPGVELQAGAHRDDNGQPQDPWSDIVQDAHYLEDTIALRLHTTGRTSSVGLTGGRYVILDLHT